MNNYNNKTLKIIPLLVLVVLLVPSFAFAQGLSYLQGMVWYLVTGVFGFFAGLAGMLLNVGINDFVIGFGKMYTTDGVGAAVDLAWTSVRDIFNITFIFGLVYIGFKMILNSDDSNTRRWLINLIMAAILVNFSLYFTKFIVDLSNIAASEIAIAGFNVGTDPQDESTLGRVMVSDTFADAIGFTSILSDGKTAAGEPITKNIAKNGAWGYIFGTMILLIIATFVFAAGGLLLIIRAVVLFIYLVLSPLMFIGWVFPQLQRYTSEYWSGFLGRAFFAPIYILLLYLSAMILNSYRDGLENNPALSTLMTGDGNTVSEHFFSSMTPFILAAVFLIASIVIANKLGANGAGAAISTGKNLSNKFRRGVINTSKNTASFAAAQTGGRVARGASGMAGRGLNRGLQNLQQGNGIIANVARSNAVQGTVGSAAARMQQTRFGLSRTSEQDTAMRNRTDREADRRGRVATDQATPAVTDTSTEAQITARQNARSRAQNDVRNMDNNQILDRARTNLNEVMSAEFASLLSEAQVNALRESGILTNTDMDTLEANRETGALAEIENVLNSPNASTDNLTAAMESLNRLMSTMSNERLANVASNNPAFITNQNVASRLSTAQVDGLRQSGQLTAAEMTNVTNARNDGFVTITRHGSLGDPTSPGGSDPAFQDRQRRGMFRSAQDAGRLPIDVLAATASAPYLTPRIVEEFLNNNPTDADIRQVRTNINQYLASGTAPANAPDVWQNWSRKTVAGRQFGL